MFNICTIAYPLCVLSTDLPTLNKGVNISHSSDITCKVLTCNDSKQLG